MKITKIKVKKLFGIFNHEIPLKLNENVTIIHGPNGYGKTVLLTMLHALFTSGLPRLLRIPFSEMSVEFDDKSIIQLKKPSNSIGSERKDVKSEAKLTYRSKKVGTKHKSYTVRSITEEDINFPLRIFERSIPGLERIGAERWFYHQTQERLTLHEVLDRFRKYLPHGMSKELDEPAWLKKIRDSIHCRFIETERLLDFSRSRRVRELESSRPSLLAVINYSEELAKAIQEKLAEYATLSQSLDRTFPKRLVTSTSQTNLTKRELSNRLSELEQKRTRLVAAGLLDKEKEIDFKDLGKIDNTNRNVLSVYIDDVKKKFAVFEELTNKIDLLVKIINSKFLYKHMSISKKDGFVFTTPGDNILSTTSLSSGEQHELVLLYELLFKVTPNSFILIDEPELSLHVVWQQQFLKDIQEIAKLTGFQVLIATHSPQIIHDRWDLTVELKGPKS